ncbi:MAG: MXAN_6640 family putative metalloprotease, partial [Chloroflexota bacterium]
LLNEDGDEVAVNDDAIPGEVFDSQIVYVAEEDGEYTIIMSNYPGFDGDYDLTVTFVTEEEAEEVNANSEVEPEVDTTPERDPDEEYTGELDEGDEDEYTIELNEGDGLIAAVYETDGFMDTVISVIDPDGVEIARNDDRGDYSTLDSQVGLVAQQSGDYTVIVSHYPDSPGEYLLEIYYATPEEASLAEQAIRLLLSGPVERFETENFVIHYTLEGVDATDEDYVELVAEVVEEVYAYQIEELGWVQPPSDILQGGDGRYDVYLANLDDVYGYVTSSSQEGDNPNTSVEETFAQAGFMVLDNDYADDSDPERALFATAAHEFHHIVQFGYDSGDMNWYYESTASWMETVTYPDDELATIYVPDVYQYPEVCFGEEGGIYGTWLFFEFMSRELGDDAPFLLWDNIVLEDGFEPLEMTLDEYDETIPSFIAQYHINNLVRDYEFIDGFGNETVWLESIIDDEGDWEPEGDGVQELGANFFYLDMSGDVYEITIDDDDLEIYVIGIEDDEGFVYSIGDSGVVDTDDFDETYIMVFNPDYDDDVSDCDYVDYELTVEETSDDEDDVSFEVDAENFRDLEN